MKGTGLLGHGYVISCYRCSWDALSGMQSKSQQTSGQLPASPAVGGAIILQGIQAYTGGMALAAPPRGRAVLQIWTSWTSLPEALKKA